MSPSATNERPLSCTCLPKLLTDNADGHTATQLSSFVGDTDDEFHNIEPVLSTSCPLPSGHNLSNENRIFSADFKERLNDYHAYRERKKLNAPRIFINDALPKISDLKSMRNAMLSNDAMTIDSDDSDENLTNFPAICGPRELHHYTSNCRAFCKPHVHKKPIVTSSPQLSSDLTINSNVRHAYTLTKQSILSTSSNSTASNNVTNVNNTTTIPHPNIVKIHNSDATQTTQSSTGRRQRHSIGQMGFFKIMDIAGGFGRKMASTNSLFSTAVISGSSSAPNLHQINTASPSGRTFFTFLLLYLKSK